MDHKKEPEVTSFDYCMSALANGIFSGLLYEEFWIACNIAKDAVEFDTAIQASCDLRDIVEDHHLLRNKTVKYKPFQKGLKAFREGNFDNPYDPNSYDYKEFERGFNRAYFARKERQEEYERQIHKKGQKKG